MALVAGSLATFNPCGFGLLPAFVSLQMTETRSEERSLSRMTRGLEIGVAVGAGFLAIFMVAAIPIALGASALAGYFSWAGLAVGLGLVVVALMALGGKDIGFSMRRKSNAPPSRPSLVAFGIGYGTASLGCTLPVLLALIGTATTSGSAIGLVGIFAAYGIGTMTTLIGIAVAAAAARVGVLARLKRLVPHMHRLSGVLLLVAGMYVTYYWGQILLKGPVATGSDVLIGPITRFAAAVERTGAAFGLPLILMAGSISLFAVGATVMHRIGKTRAEARHR